MAKNNYASKLETDIWRKKNAILDGRETYLVYLTMHFAIALLTFNISPSLTLRIKTP